MRAQKPIPRLFREDSEEPIDMVSTEDEDASLDKSSSQGVSTGESTPPASFPCAVGNTKKHQSGLPLRRVSASQPVRSSRILRPRNDTKLALRRASSAIQPSPSMDSPVAISIKLPLTITSRRASVKRKLEVLEDGPRVRKRLPLPLSEKSENTSPSEPMPGRTSDGKIDYRYYIAKYLNQRH
ncbi:hypothetical protein RSAG8_12302, partial [Rhizoctonia solani AG-8 WAC10335]